MMKATALVATLISVVGVSYPCESRAQETTEPVAAGPYSRLEIRNATIIDGTGAPASGPMTIVVENGTIAEVRRADALSQLGVSDDGTPQTERVPDRVIDATGKYVTPGFIDVHTHHSKPTEYAYKLWLAHGITAVRVFSEGEVGAAMAEKQRVMSGQVLGPKMWVYPFWPSTARASRPEEVAAIVREWKLAGADGVKVAGGPGEYPDMMRALGAETRKNGMGFATHVALSAQPAINALIAAESDASTVEHYYGYAEAALSGKTIPLASPNLNLLREPDRYRSSVDVWKQADLGKLYDRVVPELVELSRSGRLTMVPTFITYEDQSDVTRAQGLPWLKQYLLPEMALKWNRNDGTVHGAIYDSWTSGDEAGYKRMFAPWMEMVNRFKNAGGHVAVGSDSGTTFNLYGFGTIREMELMLHAGFEPLEVIRSATQEGARVLNQPKMGVIRPGYAADLLVLDENPLENFKPLYGIRSDVGSNGQPQRRTSIRYTVVGGKVVDANALLKEVEAEANKPNLP